MRCGAAPAVKICCLSSLLQALQTWPLKLLMPSSDAIEAALVEAAASPASEIRALARQCLLQHLENAPTRQEAVEQRLTRFPETKKQLGKEKPKPGALGVAERGPPPSIRRGEAGAAKRNGKLASAADSGDAGGTGVADSRGRSAGEANGSAKAGRKASGAKGGKKAASSTTSSLEDLREQLAANLKRQEELAGEEASLRERIAAAEAATANVDDVSDPNVAGLEAATGAAQAPRKPSLLKQLSSQFSSALLPSAPPAPSKPTAMEQMRSLRERQKELSEEEYAAERQRILDAL